MKKLALLAGAILAMTTYDANAQINLEHDYTNYIDALPCAVEDVGIKYIARDFNNQTIVIHNTDHTVWKTIPTTVTPGLGFTINPIISKNLFDNDNQYEFIVYYNKAVGTNTEYTSLIVNEDGTVLKTFNNVQYMFPEKVGNDWKLFVYNFTGATGIGYYSVYSLPGTYTPIAVPQDGGVERHTSPMFYPNPMIESAVLKYSLPSGVTNGTVNITNSNGVMVQQHELKGSDMLEIKRGNLPAGVYYLHMQAGDQQDTQKFIMQ